MNEDADKSDDSSTPPPPPPPPPRSLGPGYAIAGGAAVIAAVLGYTAWHSRTEFQNRLDTLAGSLETTNAERKRIDTLAGSLEAANAERQRLAAEIDSLRRSAADQAALAARADAERKALASDLAGLKGNMNRSPVTFDAAIAEAEYLAFLAVRRLVEDYDPAGAAAALQSADTLIAATNRAELDPVREQIARDRQALSTVSVPDVSEIAQTLTRAEHDIEALPFRAVGTPPPVEAPAAGPEGWRGVFATMWKDVLGLVEVRDAAPGDELLLDPARRAVLRQDLRQEFSVAKYAALRRDTADFRAAVGVVQAALKAAFDSGDAAVASLASRLDEAKALELAPQLPAIGGSLEAIRAWRAKAAAAEGAAVVPVEHPKVVRGDAVAAPAETLKAMPAESTAGESKDQVKAAGDESGTAQAAEPAKPAGTESGTVQPSEAAKPAGTERGTAQPSEPAKPAGTESGTAQPSEPAKPAAAASGAAAPAEGSAR